MKAGMVGKALSKIREMPEMAKKKPEEMDLMMEEVPEDGEEGEEIAFSGKESPGEEKKELGLMSDEELLAELRKRGLAPGKKGAPEEEMEEEEELEL